MRMLYVPLDREELKRLQDMAAAEKRRPQDQADYLITRALHGSATTGDTDADVSEAADGPR